jgi:hypothetical protein
MHHRRATLSALAGLLLLLVGSAFVAERIPAADGKPGTTVVLDGFNMAPGDVVVRTVAVAPLQPSARQHRIFVGTQPRGDPLGAQLVLTVSTVGSGCENRDGTFLFRGRAREVLVDAAADGLSGDVPDTICVGVELPIEAGDAVQARTVSVLLTVEAE